MGSNRVPASSLQSAKTFEQSRESCFGFSNFGYLGSANLRTQGWDRLTYPALVCADGAGLTGLQTLDLGWCNSVSDDDIRCLRGTTGGSLCIGLNTRFVTSVKNRWENWNSL
eukprot:8722108-Pyramimonas_sp.AAC.2